MNDRTQQRAGTGTALALLVVAGLAIVYASAYLALHVKRSAIYPAPNGLMVIMPLHGYRLGDGYINRVFWPAELVQEQIEPEAWETSKPFNPK